MITSDLRGSVFQPAGGKGFRAWKQMISLRLYRRSLTEFDYYYENGLMVMTAAYHLKRGHCCKSGCRHCPYGFRPAGA
ncbi:MAG: DUF5522 domain-containing protein [Bacteroidota bacterium]